MDQARSENIVVSNVKQAGSSVYEGAVDLYDSTAAYVTPSGKGEEKPKQADTSNKKKTP